MLKILSWNVDSATTKKAALTAFCKTEKYDNHPTRNTIEGGKIIQN